MKRTPQLAFEYDPSVERGVRMTQLIDELAPDDERVTWRRSRTRSANTTAFVLTTHENPDGDALGSLLAANARARAARQGHRHGASTATRRCRASTGSCRSTSSAATLAGRRRASGSCSRSTARTRAGSATREVLGRVPLVLDIDHHHDNTRFGEINLIVADASSTGEVLRDLFRELGVELTPEIAEPLYIALVTDTGRFQYTNTTPKALRLAAELVEAGADVHRVFQGVYESVQFAKLKLLARALERAQVYEGGRIVVSYLLRTDFADVGAAEPYSEGIIDFLRAVEGADMAVLIREPPREDGPPARQPAREHRRARRVRDRAQVRRRRPPPGRRLLERGVDRGDHGLRAPGVPCLLARLIRRASFSSTSPPGPSSFAIVARSRRRTGARTGHAGTLDPFATGLLLLLSGSATKLASCFVGLDKRYVTDVDLTARTSTGDPEGEVAERSTRRRGRAGTSPRGPPR